MCDGNIYALNQHLKREEDAEAREEFAADKQQEIYDSLVAGDIVHIGRDSYSMDDFISDVDIDVTYFCSFMDGDSRDLLAQMDKELNKFAETLTDKFIENMEPEPDEDY